MGHVRGQGPPRGGIGGALDVLEGEVVFFDEGVEEGAREGAAGDRAAFGDGFWAGGLRGPIAPAISLASAALAC